MKVAICLSGNIRNFIKGYSYICENILDCNPSVEFDIYMHSWIVELKDFKYVDDIGSFEEAVDLYKPKRCEVEIFNEHKLNELREECNISNLPNRLFVHDLSHTSPFKTPEYRLNTLMSISYGYKKVNSMKVGNYDLVIKTRYDLLFLEPLDVSFYLNDLESIYIPIGYESKPNKKYYISLDGFNDFLAIGSDRLIDVYCGLYDNLFDILKNIERITVASSTSSNLCRNNVPVNRYYLGHTIDRERYLHLYNLYDGVFTGDGMDIPVPKIDGIIKLKPTSEGYVCI